MIATAQNKLNGHYVVSSDVIESKMYAVLKASEQKTSATWWYYDEIYAAAIKKFDSTLASKPIVETYIARAKQLRESYDYLILNYSGGSDSHNILQVFLQNKIKLDHIYVQWPMSLMDRGLYTANSVDKRNSNFHSEWDLVLKKDLEWIAQNHPEITIEIADWTTTVVEDFYNDTIFTNCVTNLPSIARSQKQNTYSKTETELASKGKRVASIYGVDKPNVIKNDGLWYMYFVDTACMAQPNPNNPEGTEYFYFTPNMPEVVIHQAYKLIEWYNDHPLKQDVVTSLNELAKIDMRVKSWTNDDHYKRYHESAEIVKLVCYPYWDFSRFQADKPFSQLDNLPMGVRAWDNILTNLPNFNRAQQAWEYHWKSYLALIGKENLRSRDTFSVFRSRYHLLKLDK